MMVAAGVGRAGTNTLTNQVFFTKDGGRVNNVLRTDDQGDEFYDIKGAQTPYEYWNYTGSDSVQGNDGSPYSPQNGTNGEIYREGRSAMGDRAKAQATDQRWVNGTLTSVYVCSEICKGFYGVFYPDPTTINGQDQLAYRPLYAEGSDNPIHRNIWAVTYNAFKDATLNGFTKVNETYISAVSAHTHNCTCSS
jgi:hypothetical protein